MFNKEHFCHLLGIESIVRESVNKLELRNYKGRKGWNNIKSGTLDIKFLKRLNLRKFKNVKAKYVYFYLLPVLIEQPFGISFDKTKVIPPTDIDCELLFYNIHEDAIIHLGLQRQRDKSYYFPKTFFVEKLTTTTKGDKYIQNQERIDVHKETRTIML